MSWVKQVDLQDLWDQFTDGEMTVPQVAVEIAARLRPLLVTFPDDDAEMMIDDLEHSAETVDDVDEAMNELWNWADKNRIWIGVI